MWKNIHLDSWEIEKSINYTSWLLWGLKVEEVEDCMMTQVQTPARLWQTFWILSETLHLVWTPMLQSTSHFCWESSTQPAVYSRMLETILRTGSSKDVEHLTLDKVQPVLIVISAQAFKNWLKSEKIDC